MHISHQKVKLYTVETSISGAIARLHGTYGLATICSIHTIFLVRTGGGGGGGDSCLFAAFRTTKTSPTVGCQIFCLSCLILVVATSETL